MDRRTALATLGSAGLGLWAMQFPSLGMDADISNVVNKALPEFTLRSRKRLSVLLSRPDFSGSISSDQVKGLCEDEQKNTDALMVALLPLAKTYSRPPISHYQVGTVVRGVSGDLYFGANMEFPGHSLGFSVHGEQSACSNAYMHGDRGISAIAVTAAPCGHCRQFMNELAPDGDLSILVAGKPAAKLSSLLPAAFGPKDLGVTELAFPVKEVNLGGAASNDVAAAGLAAARKSYAPYTKAYSGVAIKTEAGRILQGSYIENAAYNPSLPPLQTALVALILSGGDPWELSEVVLVEVEGAPISQRSVAEAVLSSIAPSVKLRTVNAKMA